MIVLIILLIGILIGVRCFPLKWKRVNERIQVISIAFLIYLMGVTLGSRPNFLKELITLGYESLVLAIMPIIFSILVVYQITKGFARK